MGDFEFVMYRDRASEWRWYFWNHKNRKKIADSGEGYKNRADCEAGIALVKKHSPTAPVRVAA